MEESRQAPRGISSIDGVIHRRGSSSVDETVRRLVEVIDGVGAKVFAVIDQRGEAQSVGLSLRETKLVIVGNPAVGTALMDESPMVALDLPLKVLVWADDAGDVWMSYLSGRWLAARYGVSDDRAAPLDAPEMLTRQLEKTS